MNYGIIIELINVANSFKKWLVSLVNKTIFGKFIFNSQSSFCIQHQKVNTIKEDITKQRCKIALNK